MLSPRYPSLEGPRAVAAVVQLFAYNGLVIGVYAAAIPTLRARLALTPTTLAILFVVTGVGAVSAMQVAGRLADRWGARRLCLAFLVPLFVAAAGYALAPSYGWLLATGVCLGVGNGGVDVSMNALAVQVESGRLARGRGHIMSFFHGTWAIGNCVGALAIALIGSLGHVSPRATVLVCALAVTGLGIIVLISASLITPETTRVTHESSTGGRVRIPRVAYLMGLMAVAFGLAEGTASDWSGNEVQSITGVAPTTAAWAVAAMMACMVVIRLTGDGLVRRLGRRNLVRLGGACAAIGYLTAAFVTTFPLLIVAWALVGLGAGVIAPQVYATAGHAAGGRGLAVVVTFGYATFLVGPALIGALVSHIGIAYTMAVPGVLLIGLIPLAGACLPPREATTGATPVELMSS